MAARSRLPLARSLLAKLLVGTLGPTTIVLFAFAFWAHEEARSALEEALGRRLGAAAAGAALLVLPEQILAIGPGDEELRTYARLRTSLELARSTLNVRRVAFVAADLTGRGDSDGLIPLGGVAHELRVDAVEIERAARGTPVASPLFLGKDGRPYMRAYAAIFPQGTHLDPAAPPQARPVGYAVVEASADTIAALGRLRRNIFVVGAVGLGVIVIVGVMISRHLTGPLGRLADSAARIGAGDLTNAVTVETRDEVGQLAARLDEMRVALRMRDERLQMMLAGIAHEVRNPLGGLQLYAGLLRESLTGDADRLADVARIDREIRHLEQVVTDFLEYARRPRSHVAKESVGELFTEVSDALARPAALCLEVEPGLCAEIDRAQLRRALINLGRNALAAAGADGKVILSARRTAERPGRIEIEVRDSGPGVPADLRDKIFEPFFTTREKGTGLGLAFVREIVRDHGGEIAVGDAAEGGARFHFDLPAA
jgi:signal transduction histidine kinase